MTLHTRIFVKDKVDVEELFHYGQSLLRALAPEICQEWKIREAYTPEGALSLANDIGQGLPSMLYVDYRENQELTTIEQSLVCEYPEECGPCCDGSHHYDQAAYCVINLDTAYGWTMGDLGCGDLHVDLITAFGKWLDEQGVDWFWYNEFTGEIHHKYGRLETLGKSGKDAGIWLAGVRTS